MKIKEGKTISIKRGMYLLFHLTFFVTLLSISLVWFIHDSKELDERILDYENDFKQKQKEYLQDKVDGMINFINHINNNNPESNPDSLKAIVLDYAASYRLKYKGYIFINQYNGQALVFDGKVAVDKMDISNLTDPNGLKLFDLEKEAYHSTEGKFMEYMFKPIGSEIPEPKISFMKGYKEWEWIIGAGIYLSEPDQLIKTYNSEYKKKHKRDLSIILILSIIVFGLGYLLVSHLSKRLTFQVSIITNFLKDFKKGDNRIEEEVIQIKEFQQIAHELNNMLNENDLLTKEIINKDKHIKSIYEAANNIGFIITDINGDQTVIKEFSPGAEHIFGYLKEEIIGQPIRILFLPQKENTFKRILQILISGKQFFQGETRFKKKSNEVITALFSVHPIFKNGEITGAIGVAIDITRRKVVENELINYKENLESIVENRTKELMAINNKLVEKNKQLENYQDLFVKREFRIKELKDELKKLKGI